MSDRPTLPPEKHRIRSFSLRQGRITQAQREALTRYWNDYCLEPGQRIEPAALYPNATAPLIAEIGFGNGEGLAETAAAHRETNYLGIEVHRPGVGHLMQLLVRRGLTNVRIVCADAVEVLQHRIADDGLDGINLFFPDPWPKKRHHKRRLVNQAFIELTASKLKPGGQLHIATDWEDYAVSMQALLDNSTQFYNTASAGSFVERPADRPLTKFERRGLRLGHSVWDLIYRRTPP